MSREERELLSSNMFGAQDGDRLGLAILGVLEEGLGMPTDLPVSTDCLAAKLRETVVALGWHPPDRVIETLEELEALPDQSIVQVIDPAEDPDDTMAIVWVHALPGEWVEPGSVDYHPASAVNLPVWLRWSPPAKPKDRQAEKTKADE